MVDDVRYSKNTAIYTTYRMVRVLIWLYTFAVAFATLVRFNIWFSLLFRYLDSKIPDYYPTMYLDGYTPEQIRYAAHRKLRREIAAREAAKREEAEDNEIPEVKITSKVVIKK